MTYLRIPSFILFLAVASCGTRALPLENLPEQSPEDAGEPPPDGRPAGKADQEGEGEQDKEGGSGPKIMGYDHWVRGSFSVLSGKYSDSQENKTTNRIKKLKDIAIGGTRYTLEHYPWFKSFPGSRYGYTYLEIRDEKPKPDYWSGRQSILALMGWVLHRSRLIAPVIGIHWEFNNIDLNQNESPEVARSDLRATIVGVHYRQKIWGTGNTLAFYHKGKFHLLNLSFASNGFEAEVGLGSTLKQGIFQAGLELGVIYQRYKGDAAASEEDQRKLKLISTQQTNYAMLTFWF